MRRVSSASAVELRLGCVGPSAWSVTSMSIEKYWEQGELDTFWMITVLFIRYITENHWYATLTVWVWLYRLLMFLYQLGLNPGLFPRWLLNEMYMYVGIFCVECRACSFHTFTLSNAYSIVHLYMSRNISIRKDTCMEYTGVVVHDTDLCHHWFEWWFVAQSVPAHYLSQWWHVEWLDLIPVTIDTLNLGQNGLHFADVII